MIIQFTFDLKQYHFPPAMICLKSDFTLLIDIELHLLPASRISRLVKVAAVAPTESCKSLEVYPSLDLVPNLNRTGLVVQLVPVSSRGIHSY